MTYLIKNQELLRSFKAEIVVKNKKLPAQRKFKTEVLNENQELLRNFETEVLDKSQELLAQREFKTKFLIKQRRAITRKKMKKCL